jgi:hypothetical protein
LERDERIPASVDYEQEFQGPDGEWDSRMLTVEGDLIIEHDPYNTGDSPSISTFEPTGVIVKETGDQLNLQQFLKSLTPQQYQWIINQAAESAN